MQALVILTHSPTTKVTILERSPTPLLHNQGAGVVAGSETQTFFSKYVCPGHEIAVKSSQRLYLDRKGGIVKGSVDVREQRMTSWDVLYRLLRWRVDGMDAHEYLNNGSDKDEQTVAGLLGTTNDGPKATYQHGSTVTLVEEDDACSPGGGGGGACAVHVEKEAESGEQSTIIIIRADLVIAADGASSAVRKSLLPAVERSYAGYVAFRGTVPESCVSAPAAAAFVDKFAFFHADAIQILAYVIPGENGTLVPGRRLVNWVWYCNYDDDDGGGGGGGGGGSPTALDELMTDDEGRRHAFTLPVGGMQTRVWEKQKEYASAVLPPQFAELVHKTTRPFVQAITDVIAPENAFLGHKVLLVGDALAGFRPHTAASTSQAAFDALMLAELLLGKIDQAEYGQRVLRYAHEVQRRGVELGERSQFGKHPFAE